eukprot:4893763-Lingulodinium_polyedra.AAC.1
MMRSNRPCAATPACKSHARAFIANRRLHGVRARAICEPMCDLRAVAAPDGRFDRIILHRF